jgi:hypothetical protein
MTVEKIAIREMAKAEICCAIDGVIHNFELPQSHADHNHQVSMKDMIEHRSYNDKYYRRMLHNEFSARPIPAMVALGVSDMAS